MTLLITLMVYSCLTTSIFYTTRSSIPRERRIFMKIIELPIVDIADCYNVTAVAKKLGLPTNGKSLKLVREYITLHCLSTSHFKRINVNRKYALLAKECPVCGTQYVDKEGSPRVKTTCSHSCANTYFRAGKKHPNYKGGSTVNYRKLIDIKACNRCGFSEYQEVLQVHHIDRDRSNNSITNLEVLCPTCHSVDHFLRRDGMFARYSK